MPQFALPTYIIQNISRVAIWVPMYIKLYPGWNLHKKLKIWEFTADPPLLSECVYQNMYEHRRHSMSTGNITMIRLFVAGCKTH